MGKISRAIELTRQSGRVLMSDKQLLLFPLLSSIACLLVLATFAVPMFFAVDWESLSAAANSQNGQHVDVRMQWWYYVVLFAFYFVNFFVITFFNAGLIACAINRFNGLPATIGSGMSVATARLPQILAWSAVAATVGVILQALQERAGFIGRIVLNLIGMVWTIATFFVVPVLVVENVGPFDAIKRSVEVLKKTWGESLVGNLGIGLVTGLLAVLGAVFVAGGVALTVSIQSPIPLIIGVALFVLWLMALALISSALKGILLAATYQFAATGQVPVGFDDELLRSAFTPKKK